MAKIFAEKTKVNLTSTVTAWSITNDRLDVITPADEAVVKGDVLIIEASDNDGNMEIPVYILDAPRQDVSGPYTGLWRIKCKFDKDIYSLSGTGFTINDAKKIDVSGVSNTFNVPDSCSFEEVFENAVYGRQMKSYNTNISYSFVIPRFVFRATAFSAVYKGMGSYMVYTNDNNDTAYKLATTEETLLSISNKSARAFNFKMPTR